MINALLPEQLRRQFDASWVTFETTATLEPVTGIIGQPRGVQAIEFGTGIKSPGYNIYVLGESGTGRTTAIQRFVERRAADEPAPPDWVYVHNFREPHKPLVIRLPSGTGCQFRESLHNLVNQLRQEISRAFDNQAFRDAALEVEHDLDAQREKLLAGLQARANEMGAAVLQTPEGLRIAPFRDGRPVRPEQFADLPAAEQAAWKAIDHSLQHELNEVLHQAHKLESDAQNGLATLKQRVASSVVDGRIAKLKQEFAGLDKVEAYLDEVHQDVLDNVDLFRSDNEDGAEDPASLPAEWFRHYQVNVLVDHKESQHAPVVIEYNPSVPRLLGRVEHEVRRGGAVVTDFTLLRAGALHAANGGYLVMRARDLFAQACSQAAGCWEALKRSLVGQAIRPDDPATRGGCATRTLDPEPIPLNVKVVLIGPPGLYYHLHNVDEDFRTLFKVVADFDEVVERTPENEMAYATFITSLVHEEELRYLERQAVGRIVEYSSRLAGAQNKLSARFGDMADLIREANYWATAAGREVV
ncbi:MAG: AAA family ATPase, partial [Chloroflexi bacterium]|nr:AAA family ATPase [Chloroflexota bacterium]